MQTHSADDVTHLSDIVHHIYRAATNVDSWHEVTGKICDWMQASSGTIYTPQHPTALGGFSFHHRLDKYLALWDNKYHEHDIWVNRAFERNLVKTGALIRDQELVTDEEFINSHIYHELYQHCDIGRSAMGVIFTGEDNDGFSIVCIYHRPLERPYSTEDMHKLGLLMPHLSRALGVMLKLRDINYKVASSLLALNRLPQGVLLFNEQGQVTFANLKAQVMLTKQDGISLRQNGNDETSQLVAASATSQTLLNKAIDAAINITLHAIEHFKAAVLVDRTNSNTAYAFNFSTLSKNELDESSCAIALISDSEQIISPIDKALVKQFKLTPTEIKVINRLVNGDDLDEVAKQLAISLNTIKTHVKHIHHKTNTNSRGKLINLLIKDGQQVVKLNATLLKACYSLTQAEIKLAGLMVNGDSKDDASSKLNTSINTIKTQLQQIYQKTNTNNRAKLTKLLRNIAIDK